MNMEVNMEKMERNIYAECSKIRSLKFIVEFLNCIQGPQNLGIARNVDALIFGPLLMDKCWISHVESANICPWCGGPKSEVAQSHLKHISVPKSMKSEKKAATLLILPFLCRTG